MTKLTYGNFELDIGTLPQDSVDALLRKGFAHFMGNEQASKVTAWKAQQVKENGVEPGDQAISDQKIAYQQGAIKALQAGTVGHRAVGVSVSPIEKIMRQLAKEEVVGVLKANDLAFPKGEAVIVFNEGTDQEQKLSAEDLIERRLEAHSDRLRKEAEAEIKRREREAKKKAEAAAAAGGLGSLLG